MKRFVLILIFLLALAAGLIANTPMAWALRQSPLGSLGFGWQQARGTVWKGEVLGLVREEVAMGSVQMTLRPVALVRGEPPFFATWTFGQSRAVANLGGGQGAVVLTGVSADVLLHEAAPDVAAALGVPDSRVRFQRGEIEYGATGCRRATGVVTTDALALMGLRLGQKLPDITGPVACEAGRLVTTLGGRAEDGTDIRLVVREGDMVTLTLDKFPAETGLALSAAGYAVSGTHVEHTFPIVETVE
ncbi:MAG: type II secretion system protein N [Hyphomonas sp.]|nr:type II secretion system protein N [Hyphomonas sp.]